MEAIQKRITPNQETTIQVPTGRVTLSADVYLPEQATGIVLFAHGSGSSRKSPRNRYVAGVLHKQGLATILFDLFTLEEEAEDLIHANLRFNIKFLTDRLTGATDWTLSNDQTRDLKVGYFGASTGAAAALVAAAERPQVVRAVVSRGGRPDMAREALPRVKAPTLLIVGGRDHEVITLNREALVKLTAEKEMVIVPGATHLFEEPGALEEAARLAADWFSRHLR